MLSQYDKRLDPMVSLHKMKTSQGGGGRRYQSPFMMRATANTSIGGGSTGETGRKNNTTYSGQVRFIRDQNEELQGDNQQRQKSSSPNLNQTYPRYNVAGMPGNARGGPKTMTNSKN